MSFLGAQNSIALGVQGLIHIDTGVVGSADYLLAKSLRFRASASAYLNRTFAAGNQKTWTWSGWVKRGTLSANQTFFGQGTGVLLSGYGFIRFDAADTISIGASATGAISSIDWNSTPVYRDPAAWYHVVAVLDTTQGTGSDRFKLYVNGAIQSGTFATTPSSSADIQINRAAAHQIAVTNAGSLSGYFDGELAEVNFVDGQALAPTAFGATGANSQWLPKAYTGTYGTNGFYLPFNSVSTSSYAGSFNGSNQYLSMPLNAVLTLGSGNFTVEAWIIKSTSGSGEVFGKTGTVNYAIDCATLPGNNLGITLSSDGLTATTISGSTTLATNRWYHVAWVRSGTTVNIYLNGVLDGTGTFSGAIYSGSNVDVSGIGARPGSGITPDTFFNGYISNLRVVKGTAVYTAAFTPPVAPLTAITNTSLLTLQSATIVDNSGNSVSITNNNTVVTSVQYPFTLAIAADSSGNANNWTPNNISLTAGSTYDSLTDVPTLTSETVANYAVLNPLETLYRAAVISNGNLTYDYPSTGGSNSAPAISTIAISSGTKVYFELVSTTSLYPLGSGIRAVGTIATSNQYLGYAATEYAVTTNGNKVSNNVSTAYGTGLTAGDVLGCAVDLVNGKIYWSKNGAWFNSGDPAVGTNPAFTGLSGNYFACVGTMAGANTCTGSVNFGQQPFTYTAPSGFLPLNTFNIAAGTVTTSGTFTGNLSTDGPFVFLNGTPTAMTINGNAVTFGTHADKLANGFKVRSSSASYNASGSNTYVATTVGAVFKYEDAQSNP